MSRVKEVLRCVVDVVAAECDVEPRKIMGRHSDAETVDARWICVKLLRVMGYYPMRIAEMMGITPRYVQYILTDFEDRIEMNIMMRTNYEMARRQLRSPFEMDGNPSR